MGSLSRGIGSRILATHGQHGYLLGYVLFVLVVLILLMLLVNKIVPLHVCILVAQVDFHVLSRASSRRTNMPLSDQGLLSLSTLNQGSHSGIDLRKWIYWDNLPLLVMVLELLLHL